MGRYYRNNINKASFKGVKYRELEDSLDYALLQYEVKERFGNMDMDEVSIEIDNKIENAEYEKEMSISVNLPIVIMLISLVFTLVTTLIGAGIYDYSIVYTILIIVVESIIYFVFCIWYLCNRAPDILKTRRATLKFYSAIKDNIEKIR